MHMLQSKGDNIKLMNIIERIIQICSSFNILDFSMQPKQESIAYLDSHYDEEYKIVFTHNKQMGL